jgi:hypothetical protein
MVVWVWFCVYKVFGMLHLNMLISYEILNPSQKTYGVKLPSPNMLQILYAYIYTIKFEGTSSL